MKKYLFILLSVSCFGQFNPSTWHNLSGNYKVNTYIGGIGATINTPALLASKLGISVGRIKKFKVVGANVECAIVGGSYVASGFDNDVSITSFLDTDGLVTDFYFRNCINLTGDLIFKGVKNLVNGYVIRSTKVQKVVLENCTSVKGASFYNGDHPFTVRDIQLPKCTQLGNTSGFDGVFNGIESGSTITVNSFLQTNNGGLPDGDLTYAITQGATVIYVP